MVLRRLLGEPWPQQKLASDECLVKQGMLTVVESHEGCRKSRVVGSTGKPVVGILELSTSGADDSWLSKLSGWMIVVLVEHVERMFGHRLP